MGTICQALCDAANMQRLQEQHLQPILQALLQPAPAALPCQATSNSSAACRNVASSSSHSSDWRSYTVHLLLSLAQQHERFLQGIALKLPELLRGAAADAVAALAVFDLVQCLDRSGGSCQKVVLQELQLLLAAVKQQLQPCMKSTQQGQQQQGQQQLLQPCVESGQQQGQQQQLNEDEEEEVWQEQASAGAAAVLLGLLSSARELLLSQQHLAATVDCLLAVAARYQHSFSDDTTSGGIRGAFNQAVWHLAWLPSLPGAADVLSDPQRLQLAVDITAGELQQQPCTTAVWRPQHEVVLQLLQQLVQAAASHGRLLPCVQQLADWLQQQVAAVQQLQASSMLDAATTQRGKDLQQQQQQQQLGQAMHVPEDMSLEQLQQLLDALPLDYTINLEAAAAPSATATRHLQQQQQLAATVARIVSLLGCLAPLAGFDQGLMVLNRHAVLLQQAAQLLRAAAVPSSSSGDSVMQAAEQAEQRMVAAGVRLQRVQQEHATAREELQRCLISVVGTYVGSNSSSSSEAEAAPHAGRLIAGADGATGTAFNTTAAAAAAAAAAAGVTAAAAATPAGTVAQAGLVGQQRRRNGQSWGLAVQAVRDLAAASSREAALAELLLLAGAG
uniref:Uncharacterized protein n=1 Tax=Tetradesmus obliquus TaxID=3088 RepID=A0A383W4M6_TETOB|eukprot:jgi/Sobl393_1/10739/SZX72597.1